MLTLTLRSFYRVLSPTKLRFLSTESQNDIVFKKLSGNDSGIAIYGLNRQKDRNALGYDFVKSMRSVNKQIKEDTTVQVVVVHSLVPSIFCAGANLKERLKMTEAETIAFVNELRSLSSELATLSVATIAALDGAAMSGGLELAICCDILIAAETAKLGLVETGRGVIPGAGGTQRLSRLIGPNLAKELILTARVVDGKEAKELGIVNHVVPQNAAKNAAFEKALLIARSITPNAPIALKCAKQAINEGLQLPIEQALEVEGKYVEKNVLTAVKDRKEGIVSFIEKRKPVYRGIVNHVVPQNAAKNAAFEKALLIAGSITPNAPIALKCAKQAINEGLQLPIEQALEVEGKYVEKNVLTAVKDRKEGIVSFIEKRKPVYRGE